MKKLKFYKEESGKWYVDLPDYTGEKEDLQMVYGADTLLDIVSGENSSVILEISLDYKEGFMFLKRIEEDILNEGSYYWSNDFKMEIWLCDVLRWVYGILPKEIYFRKK